MSAFLIVDVDDLKEYLEAQTFAPNIADITLMLRNTAALAAGMSSEELSAIAVANWNQHRRPDPNGVNLQQAFVTSGYDLFNISERKFMADALLTNYFPIDTEATIDELILVSAKDELLKILDRLNLPPQTRKRVWADVQPPQQDVIFQPLDSILGVKSRSVALYIDFENISISLNEQGYIVDLDLLLNALKARATNYGQIVHMAAYAPWGQRGSLPPMLDTQGREISDDVPSRLAMENIDPVFSLPGKNSADLRIAKDVLAESSGPSGGDIVIIASGDRDFNDIYNTLRARGKQVVVWGVQGSTSRVLENNTSIKLEYIDDFSLFRRHRDLNDLYDDNQDPTVDEIDEPDFRPSQWSSLVLQVDYLVAKDQPITKEILSNQLSAQNITTNSDRANDLIEQAIEIGILQDHGHGVLALREEHPIVSKTHLIRDHMVTRVGNTLEVRNWDYVNYGFLLKGIAMDDKLVGAGINLNDNWRSEWIDFFVREGILERELIPHRHNPDDLVPVIRVPDEIVNLEMQIPEPEVSQVMIETMKYRVVVSVEQFTSFRNFVWCPLGSLHKRLRPFDVGTAFQQAVEQLEADGAIRISEYENPQSNFTTKGVSLVMDSSFVENVLQQRNHLIRGLVLLHNDDTPVTVESIQQVTGYEPEDIELWISIMLLENVLNKTSGQPDTYTLFRTHHTVTIVAGA